MFELGFQKTNLFYRRILKKNLDGLTIQYQSIDEDKVYVKVSFENYLIFLKCYFKYIILLVLLLFLLE